MKQIRHLSHKIAFTWLTLLTATTMCLYTREYADKKLYELQLSNLVRQVDYNTNMLEQQRRMIMEIYMSEQEFRKTFLHVPENSEKIKEPVDK